MPLKARALIFKFLQLHGHEIKRQASDLWLGQLRWRGNLSASETGRWDRRAIVEMAEPKIGRLGIFPRAVKLEKFEDKARAFSGFYFTRG